MSKPVVYVGVDVGKDEVWAAMAGQKLRSFPQTATGAQALVAWATQVADVRCVHVCMESTSVYSRSLAVRLVSVENLVVSMVNPAQVKAFSRAQLRRTKTDRVDARVILAFAQSQHPAPWRPEPEAVRKLCALVTLADTLREDQQRWKNRRHALDHPPDALPEVRPAQQAVQAVVQDELVKVERAIRKLVAEEPSLREAIQALRSITGIGPISSARLVAYGNVRLTERTPRQATAHAGPAPSQHQSGSSVHGKSHLAKQGDKRLRTALYMPILSAIQHNPVIKASYERLRERGKPNKVAMVACMRKPLLLARAIMISRKPFDPCFQQLT